MSLWNWITGKTTPETFAGVPRSPRWGAFRTFYLKGKSCAACGGVEDLEAHHIIPFHQAKDLEMVTANLVPLCRTHHFVFGHCGDWSSANPHVLADAAAYLARFQEVRGKKP